jgi:glycosyltransferase involved in cell wall biosynthesis
MDRLMREYPNIKFKTIGSFFSGYKTRWGQRYSYSFGDMDVLKWIEKAPTMLSEVDILVAPLVDNIYNRCKSSCKFLEASSFKKPGCWQGIRQYEDVVKDGVNGFLCTTTDDWYFKLKRLIDDKQLRQNMAEEAFKTIQDWQIQSHIEDYKKFFADIPLDKT